LGTYLRETEARRQSASPLEPKNEKKDMGKLYDAVLDRVLPPKMKLDGIDIWLKDNKETLIALGVTDPSPTNMRLTNKIKNVLREKKK